MTRDNNCQEYDCRMAEAELDAFVRGELPMADAGRMQVHLERCGHCASVARHEQAFRERLRRVASGCCPEALRLKIETLLSKESPGA